MSRLAWITGDQQVAVARVDGSEPRLLTGNWLQGHASWSQLVRSPLTWSWPTWSPDGDQVAAFAVEVGDERTGPVRVMTLRADGSEDVLWYETGSDVPIYLQWRPDGEALALLTQRDEQLALGAIERNALGRLRPVESGVPLFFEWLPDGSRIFCHASERGAPSGRLVLRDPFGDADDTVLAHPPGSFCAPVFGGGEAIWGTPDDGGTLVVAGDPARGTWRPLLNRKGLLALVPAPGGVPLVAVSSAPGGEGNPYDGIDLLDLRDGSQRSLTRRACLAYFWSPTGDWLLAAQVSSADNCLCWWRIALDGSEDVALGTFWPSREVIFVLHFFDQYTGSHPLISADGRYIVFAGYPAGKGHADLSRPPRVYLRDMHHLDEPATEVDSGAFAVFSPKHSMDVSQHT
jgi:hypothetical protein